MSETDPRKKFILSQVRTIFQLNEVPRGFYSNHVLDDFLNTTQVNAIKIYIDTNSKSLEVSPIKTDSNGAHDSSSSGSIEVCITKVREEEISLETIQKQIIISTINANPLLTLLNQLTNVYLPTLESAKWADQVDNNIKRLLDELKAGLDNNLTKGQNLNLDEFDENTFLGILSPVDEFELWQTITRTTTNSSLRARAQYYNEEFSRIWKSYQNLKSIEISGLKDVIDQTLEVVDNVWNFGKGQDMYKEKRMENLLDLFSTALGGRIQSELPDSEIWNSSFLDAKSKLNECIKACKAWVEGLYTYTQQIWMSKTAQHRWKDEKYTNVFMNNLVQRLEEILDIRTQHDELLRIYSLQKGLKINFEEIFSPFKQVNSLHVSVYALPAWENAKSQYSSNIEAVESDIANYLRQEIFADLSNPSQAVKEMERWQGLLSRPNMMKLLQTERDQLLANLFTYVDKIKQEFESQSGQIIDDGGMDGVPSAHNLSPVVNAITWVRSLSSKVTRVLKSGQTLLSGLKKFENFENLCRELHEETKAYENEQFESWRNDILEILKRPNQTLSLQMSGKLMELDMSDNLLKVNYSDRLVLLLKEVRQLCEMGFRKQIPNVIHKTAEDGKRFYKEALTLKQIANFYNAMDLQTIESQKPMLAALAIKFEEVVLSTPGKTSKNESGVSQITWNDPEELERYIARAQEAAQGIMNEIRNLRKVHLAICDRMNELFNVDLLKNRNTWKERIEKIRGTIDSVAEGRDPKLVRKWRQHWDYQLYKVLEYQYQRGLENLNQNLVEIKVELVYSSKNVSYKPPLEELRQKYYKEVKAFITFPSTGSQNFGGSPEIFKQMPERNSKYLSVVYQNTEELFSKLLKFMDSFKQWTSIGAINMEVIIEKHFKSNEDWEFNLKNLRLKRRDLEKVPETYKIDCFTISLSPFKNTIEDLIQRHIETMTSYLRNSIKVECDEIDEFINYAHEKLTNKPSSIEEITQSKAEVYEINQKRQQLADKFKHTEEKNKLLRNMIGNAHNISNISKRWENFDVALEGFNQMLNEQQEVIKNEIEKKCNSLNSDIEKFYQRWSALKPKKLEQLDRETAKETAAKTKEWRAMWDELEKKAQTLETDSKHFELSPPEFSYIAEIRAALVEQEQSWKYFDEFEEELANMEKEDWLSFRTKVFTFQDFTFKWADKLKTLHKDACCLYLLSQVDLYKQIWPVLKLVIGEAFEKEHWKTLFSMLKISKDVNIENLTFGHLLRGDRYLLEKETDIKDLAARAQGEVTLREAINELRVWCDTTDFTLTEHNSNGRATPIIKEWKELMTKVSDNQALLGTLKESKFYDRFKDQIEQFEAKLGGIDDYLQKLNIIQRKWIYLEPIFNRGALPQEQPRFKRLDDEFRGIMLGIQRDPKVVGLCAIPGIKDTLEMILDQLERCQKALNNFLEEKRLKFPRFYFLGDDDLLEILGQAKNPNIIQIHLKKLFAGIHTVQFSQSMDEIVAMKSLDGENVPLLTKVVVDDEIETWLGHLSKNMQVTLQKLLISSLKEGTQELQKYPSQILNLTEEVNFYNSTLKAISQNRLSEFRNELLSKLESFTNNSNVNNHLIQLKLKALILDLIHQIDVIDQLVQARVTDPGDWQWYKQLKFFVQPSTQICQILMCKAQFDYTYEYQGNAPKLVHTPLTDKCYLTLTQGMSMGLGGNPYGPAGTGKTESVKALGQAFGRQVLVFNCDEGIDFKSMGRIFVGLVKCGAWGCFDEFNRLLEEQLSAISQQIQVIQFAIKENEPSVELLAKTVEVNKNAGIFVTMNPAGKAYGGRSKLPDNLKQLFRPVAMSVPDNELIAEVLLFAEGFKTAKVLAKKIVSVFNLSKQLLSSQQHYDWGLRALKTILTVGGQLIQEERKKGAKLDQNMEATLLIKAIRVNTMSKLTYSDSRKFVALLNDIFPGIAPEDIAYEVLTKAIKEVLVEMKLDEVDSQIHKILQFYEATKQRMGIVLVGPSGSGKTTIWKVLKKAHEKMNRVVKTHVMNPKSMPRTQLLGYMDHDTREFVEGVLTFSARQVVKESADVLNWIVCDGDIDPEWIESLNSVLDDNHLLTLPTGERINFGNNVNFIFETHDLQYASPATVSRMGMIFLNYEDINIKSLINRWVKKQNEAIQPKLEQFIEEYFYKAFDVLIQNEDLISVNTTRVGTIMNALSEMYNVNSKGEFVEALIKGLAANFPPQARAIVCEEITKELGVRPPVDSKTPLDFHYAKDNGQFRPYAHDLTNQLKASDFLDPLEPPLVRTIGAQRDLDLIKCWVQNGDPFVLVGPEGCGKNLLIRNAFEELKKTTKIQIAVISCNAQTAASQIIQKLNQVCLKAVFAQGRIYRPKEASRLVIYLKDINLPKPDKYQTIQMIAFLQQIITHRGFYDENLEFVYLDEKIQIVASMNPPGTLGRYTLSTRFTAIVRIAYVDYPTQQELSIIYTEYLKAVLQSNQIKLERSDPASIENLAKKIAPFMVDLFLNVKQKFSIDEHRHYLYTPANLTAIVYGLLRYQIGSTEQLFEIVSYEACRVFKDRIVNVESMSKFDNLLLGLLKQTLKFNFSPKDIYYSSVPHLKEIKEGSKEVPYLTRLSKEDLKNIINQGLVTYEREFTELKIHFLDETLELIAQLDRTLSRPGGAVLLAGRSGIAKRMCALLVGHMLRLQIFTPLVTRDYTIREFKKDLRAALENAAVQDKPTLLFVEDHHITQKEFLEMLNSLLSSGEVPGLYRQEEIESLLSNNAEEIRRENFGKSLYDCFVARVQTNLRIVLNFECTHPDFASNTASNPALFSRCNIIWLENWSKESYLAIAKAELEEILSGNPSREDIQNYLIAIHRNVGPKAAPRHYFGLINTFKKIFGNKIQNRGNQTSHLQAGLRKLVEAQVEVDKLTGEAHQKKKELAVKQAEADQALKEITKSMQEAAERKQETEMLSGSLEKESKVIQTHKVKIDEELRDIQPMIDQAKEAVGSIARKDLDEVKSFKFPPEPVVDVFSVVLRMMGQEDTSFSSIKKFLGPKTIENILNFDASKLTPQMRMDIQREIAKKSQSFEKSVITRASVAAAPISDWVKATLKYSEILEKIQPLISEQTKLQKKLQVSEARLYECQKQLAELDEKVIQLKDNFGQRTSEAEALKLQLKKAEETLGVAQNLLGKLSDEKNRWEGQVKQLESQLKSLPYDSLLAAAFVVYLSDADEVTREETLKEWKTLMKAASFDYMKFISTESQILKWKSEGLPGDSLSLENSLMIFNTAKTPLLIDPNTAASEWLKRHFSHEKNLEIINQNDSKLATSLELAVRFGKIMIIQEIDYVDSLLFPLLRKDVYVQGPRSTIQLGEKTIDYNANFSLYLTTRNPLIEIPPNAKALVSVINYTVTISGLEGQLLSIIINHEKPELEQKKTELLHNEEKLKVQLADLEKTLLEELASSQGNILENKTLIESLNQTKSKSNIISESLKESTMLQESLDKQREAYRSLAHKGSKLFIVINDLQKINNMYRFSLALYLRLFKKCLDFQSQTNKLEEKLEGCTNSLYRIVFDHIGTSLFKKDRLMFGLHIVKGMMPELFQANEWEFFLGHAVGNIEARAIMPKWASEDRKDAFTTYASVFNRLASTLQFENEGVWKSWYEHLECEKGLPGNVRGAISSFQRVLITQVFRPDRVESALNLFVCESLRIPNISAQAFSLRNLYREESNMDTPVLFVTSPGSDPSKELEEFAEAEVGRDNFQELSMGGGQNELAIQMLREAASKGLWLCFKNLHLVVSWLPSLEKELKGLNAHSNFRLWLTTEPHLKFPPILLETCHKVTYEAPPGIKKNLQRTYQGWSPSLFDQSSAFKARMYFVLSWFHAIVQERRTYIPQGWSKFYEFSYGDLKAGTTIIDNLLADSKDGQFNWEALYGLLESAIYGGRIDNELDLKVLRAYLEQYYNEDVMKQNKKVAGLIALPDSQAIRDYLMLISKLPENDSPNFFGLPINIDRSVQRFNTSMVVEGMKRLQAGSTENIKFDREKWSELLGPIIKLWKTLYKQVKEKGIPQIKEKQLNSDDPIESFIYTESSNCFQMLEKIDNSIDNIGGVLAGTGLLNSAVQSEALSLLTGDIPPKWLTIWEGPVNPNSWMKGFCKRAFSLKSWVHALQQGNILTSQLNLADLFHPEIFLNAVRQLTSRKIGSPIDNMKLACSFEPNKLKSPVVLQVKDLLLQGCGFQLGKLVDPPQNGPEFITLPTCYLAWLSNSDVDPYMENTTALVPVYASGAREKMLTKLKVPNNGNPNDRIIGGVAICLADDE